MTRSPLRGVTRRIAAAVAVATLAAACAEPPTGGGTPTARIPLHVNTNATPVTSIVVTVTAPDIAEALLFNIPVVNGVASGTILVTAGSQRTITLQAFDAAGIETHRGSQVVAVVEGNNPTVSITLVPLTGSVPITATLGSVILVVSPAADTLLVGDGLQLALTVVDSSGAPPATPRWATSNPARASVDSLGFVTALDTGNVTIAVAYGSATKSVQLRVAPGQPLAFTQVAAGAFHTCALTTAGETWCWGLNEWGQAGAAPATETCSGTIPCLTQPTRVVGAPVFTQLAIGQFQSCGLAQNGSAWCWGQNGNGQLGNGTSAMAAFPTPTQVQGGQVFASLESGTGHVCGVRADGTAFCWGFNTLNRLGFVATEVCAFGPNTACATLPTQVPGGQQFASITTWSTHTCGLTTTGAAWCWGAAGNGQIGHGTSGGVTTGPVAVGGGHQFARLAAGNSFTCGQTTGGSTYCWGANFFGQFGNGTFQPGASVNTFQATPLAIAGMPVFDNGMSAGQSFACGATSGGDVYCWGANGDGQLGRHAVGANSATPDLVVGGLSFASISTGTAHACGLTAAGAVWCWGRNAEGQLARGASVGIGRPVSISVAGGQP